MEGRISITDLSASDALMRYAGIEALRGKNMAETMQKIMRFWVSFAIKKIPPGSEDKIWKDMTALVTSYARLGTKRSKTADAWRGTYAAMIVAKLNWQGARTLRGAAFYGKARLFANRRKFAANLHRSGMRPAIMQLRGRMGSIGRMKKFKSQPGGYVEKVQDRVVDILVENWAAAGSPGSVGITGLAGGAFETALAEVETMLADFFLKDTKKWAEKVGLTADPG